MTKSLALIDGPNPLAPLAEWEAYVVRMAALAPTSESAASELADAKRMVEQLSANSPEPRREEFGGAYGA